MRITCFNIIVIFILTLGSIEVKSQTCSDFHRNGDCQTQYTNRYMLSSLSKSFYLDVTKTLTYEVVLYGEYEIIVQCCTNEDYFIRFQIISSDNGNTIYDNKYNNYLNNLNLLLDHTELMSIKINVEPKKKRTNKSKVCIGMAIYNEKQ